LACRTYDLQNDPQIRNWLEGEKKQTHGSVEINVSPLTAEVVKLVAEKVDQNKARLSERQIQILQLPQHLAMWVRIVRAGGAVEFQNRIQLIREFWADRMQELASRGVSGVNANAALTTIVTYMERNGSITAPQSIIDDPIMLDALCACGLVGQDSGQIAFSHQSYLDYQIASRVVREIYNSGGNVCDWLGGREKQSLFRREQLRQALCLLNEDSPDEFLKSVKSVLSSEGVRFHLKHLCLEVLGQLDRPSGALIDFLSELIRQEEWKEHIFGTVYFRHEPYVKHLIDNGAIRAWLDTDSWRNYGLWMFRGVCESLSDEVAKELRPYFGQEEEWNDRILATMPWHAEDDSDDMFNLRLDLARRGVFREYVNWEKLDGGRSLYLLEAVVSSWEPDDLSEVRHRAAQTRSRFERWSSKEAAALRAAVQTNPAKAWELFIPHLCRLVPVEDEPYGALQLWIEGDHREFRQGMECVPHALVELVVESGKSLAATESADYWKRTEGLRDHESPVIQYILVEAYSSLSAEYTNAAIDWLLNDASRLSIGTGQNEPEWAPAARLISKLSPHCSRAMFQKLEHTLIHYHSPDERRSAEYWLTTWKNGFFGDYWGRAQHFLLPALDSQRRSIETIGLIGVLGRKYESYSTARFLRRSHGKGGFVGSTLGASADRISDRAWLRIVMSKKVPVDGDPIKHWHDDHLAESSIRMFSRDLARVAQRFPSRFGRLALQFPSDIAPEYRAAILEGLTSSNAKDVPEDERAMWEPASVDLIEKVIERFARDSSRTYAINFCWLMYHRADEKWSETAFDQLKEYACNHENPEANDLVIGNETGGFDASEASVANLENNALNCVRGVAGLAIGEQLRNHPHRVDQCRTVLEHLFGDPHSAVRIAGVEACLNVLHSDRDFAIRCFCRAASGDIRVAASRWAVYYFNVGIESHHDQLAPVILEMLESDRDEVAREGAAVLTARWIFHDYFADKIEDCLAGSIPHRRGVAHVAASLVHKLEYLEKCSDLIERLKNDSEVEVRQELREIVNSAEILSGPRGIDLVKSFVQSQAFLDDPSPLVFTLREHTGRMMPFADVLFSVCGQFVGPLSDTTRDPARGIMHDLSEVLPMLIRLYEEATEEQNSDIVNKCLDTFDSVFERRLGMVSDIAQLVG
jgi:hypothetical protein